MTKVLCTICEPSINVGRLRDDLSPRGRLGVARIDGDDPSPRAALSVWK